VELRHVDAVCLARKMTFFNLIGPSLPVGRSPDSLTLSVSYSRLPCLRGYRRAQGWRACIWGRR